MKGLRVAVVDDEKRAREGLAGILESDARIETVEVGATASDAVRLARAGCDLMFLDIEMPGGDGFSVLAELDAPPAVVFVTAWSEHAVRAFDAEAVDYLVKPFTDERVAESVRRAIGRLKAGAVSNLTDLLGAGGAIGDWLTRFAVRRPGRTEFVPVDRVGRMEAEADYVRLILLDGGQELVRGPLGALEDRLDPRLFVRTHRSHAVAIPQVRAIHQRASGTAEIEMRNGDLVPVSARRRAGVIRQLEGSGS